nr:ADP-dependent glucokinase/phosphofructokinase [Microbacterium bovistercoris]
MQPAKRISTDAHSPSGPGRIVLGLGGTIDDEIVWDARVLEGIAREHGIRIADCDPTLPIRDERSLACVILGFARERRGGERFVESPDVIRRFAARHDKTVTLGGTCVRAALMMRTLGVRSTVHLVSIDDDFRRLYPKDCDYISSATRDGMYPHLIVQLPEHDRVALGDGEIVIEGPNRLIFTNDPPHVQMALSPDFAEAARVAEWLLISGFNVMTDADVVKARLAEVQAAIEARTVPGVVMYEDAAFHDIRLHEIVRTRIAPAVDVYSMNEDELQSHLGRSVELLDTESVARALRDIRVLVPGPTLIVHTRHWALAYGEDAARFTGALRGGTSAATARYAHGDRVTAEQVAAIAEGEPPAAHSAFAEEIVSQTGEPATCVPVQSISVERPTTIGLGDCFVGGFLAALAAAERIEAA